LYLDFDSKAAPTIVARITACCRLWQWPVEAIRFDRTRRGWHVIIGVRKKIAPALIVAAQAILGSDPNREAFNVMRVQQLDKVSPFWRKRFNVLYASHSRGVSLPKPAVK
jgi:hypothetical protein